MSVISVLNFRRGRFGCRNGCEATAGLSIAPTYYLGMEGGYLGNDRFGNTPLLRDE
jgi:hypothetical protein